MTAVRSHSTSLERVTQGYLGQEAVRGTRERRLAGRRGRAVRVREVAAVGRMPLRSLGTMDPGELRVRPARGPVPLDVS